MQNIIAEIIIIYLWFLVWTVNNPVNMDLVLVTGLYLSNPWVPVSPPHYMPALVLFHCLLNSVSGSPGLCDCLVITRRRLFLSGIQRAMAVIQWDACRAII